MSGIGKLKIKGIRAFSEEHPAAIEMQHPLTLIVGHNGTGKTTIVEALKYATTGSLPPNSRNGAFVHDPRVSQETETKAQIMMKFTSCEGKEYIVARGMSQTVGKTKKETRTCESALWEIQNGEKKMICNKLSEVDSEVPLLLGTTAAVLESVIFVHQEESTWPLGDGTVLKKKMDGILSSSQFIKALDSLTALKKEKTAELKILGCKYETLQQKTQNKHLIEQRIIRAEERLGVIKNVSKEAKIRLDAAQLEIKEKQKSNEHALLCLREKEKAESELAGLSTKNLIEKPVSELQRLIPSACKEDVEELQQEECGLEIEAQEIVDQLRKLEGLRMQIEKNRIEIEELLEDKRQSTGRIEQEVSEARDAFKRIYAIIQSIIEEAEKEDNDRKISDFKLHVLYLAESNEKYGIEDRKIETDTEIESAAEYVTSTAKNVVGAIEQMQELLDYMVQKKETVLRGKIEEMGVLREKQRGLIRRLEEIKSILNVDLDERETSFIAEIQENENIVNISYERREYNKEKLFFEIEELQREIDMSLKEAEKRKEKEFLQEEIERKEKDMEYTPKLFEIKGKLTLESLLLAEETVEMKVLDVELRIKEIQQSQKEQIEVQIRKESRRMASALFHQRKVEKIEEILQEVTGEIAQGGRQITKSEIVQCVKTGGRVKLETEFENMLYDLNEEWGGITASEKIYEEFLKRAQEECPFCKSFISTGVSKGHMQKIEAILGCIKRKKQEIQKEMDGEKENTRIKQHQSLLRTLINEVSKLSIEGKADVYGTGQKETENLNELLEALESLNKQLRSIKNVRGKFQEIEALVRRKESIQLLTEDYCIVQKKYKEKLAELQEIEKKEQKEHERYIEFENRKQDSRNRIKEIEKILQQRSRYKEEAMSLEKEKHAIEAEKEQNDRIIKERTQEINELNRRESAFYKSKEILRECQIPNSRIASITSMKGRVKELSIRMERLSRVEYTEDHKKSEMALKNQIIDLEERKAVINRRIKIAVESQAHKQLVKDSIRAADLREKIESIHVTQQTLFDLQMEIDELEGSIMKEQKTISECVGEEHNLKKQKEEDVKDVKIYESAESDELSAFVTIRVIKETILDLDKYIKGVQAGIVRYHSEKLAEVNAIIKEVWDLAYKGGDIDEIKLVSYLDKTYSLVMIKNGVEIEMRGRVSAGQKVLASIVVRLALAEAFSFNCGFLSLDEPTTNLDKENIAGLAKALSAIIKSRKAEGNFQLLIITHDEEFVRVLLEAECTEYFYRLERDTLGFPKIVQLFIFDI